MQLRKINRNAIVEHKKILEKHKKAIDTTEVMAQEKTIEKNLAIKKDVIKKKAMAKKAIKEKQKIAAEKVMDDVRKRKIKIEKNSLEEEHEESKVIITKEERAERFKRLHAMVQDMMKKRNE